MPVYLPMVCLASAFLASAVATAVVRRWARAHGFVDRPGGHKAHTGEVALGGGIAIVAAVVLPMLAVLIAARLLVRVEAAWLPDLVRVHLPGLVSKSREGTGIIAGAIVLHILGLVDDVRPLRAGAKFLVQATVAAMLAILFDLRALSHLGLTASTLITVVWIVAITNAFNFLDNMDGLSAGVAIIAGAIYSITAVLAGQVFVPACLWLLIGALLGFLPYNFEPASIYLGDAGSTVVGYLIAVFTIMTTFYDPAAGQQPAGVIAPLVVLAVPLYDTAAVVLIRARSGRPIWVADRHHFSHRLVRAGMSPRRAVGVIWLATLATALPALMLPRASWPVGLGVLAQTAVVVALVALMESAGAHDRAQR